jgi:hypothetical protein
MDKLFRNWHPWPILFVAVALSLGGSVLLVDTLRRWPVSDGRDWRTIFFVALWLVLAGLTLPLIWYLHRRFGRADTGEGWLSSLNLMRQAAWVATWGTLCAWMQANRTLNLAMALLLLIILILVEALILTRQEASTKQ